MAIRKKPPKRAGVRRGRHSLREISAYYRAKGRKSAHRIKKTYRGR